MAGWRPLHDLRPGDHIAAFRALPPLGRRRWSRHRLIVLADLIAEGNLCHPSTPYFYTTDSQYCDEYVRAVEQFKYTRDGCSYGEQTSRGYLGNVSRAFHTHR